MVQCFPHIFDLPTLYRKYKGSYSRRFQYHENTFFEISCLFWTPSICSAIPDPKANARTMAKAGQTFSREIQRLARWNWSMGERAEAGSRIKTPCLFNKQTARPPKHTVPTRLAFLPGSGENRTGQCSFGKACQQAAAGGPDRVLHLRGPRDICVPNGCGVRCHSVFAPCTLYLPIYHTTSGAVHSAQCVRRAALWQKHILVDKGVHLL